MARKKTITHDQILNAAYDLVVEQGFKSFTARNIAKKMNCSTQPIYLEFKNMAELIAEKASLTAGDVPAPDGWIVNVPVD